MHLRMVACSFSTFIKAPKPRAVEAANLLLSSQTAICFIQVPARQTNRFG
jgi:hypothetical protein